MSKIEQKVLEVIEANKQEMIDTLSATVAIESITPNYPQMDFEKLVGGESMCNDFLAERCRQWGLEPDMWEEVPQRANLVAVLRGRGGGRSLILNGHIDTVPVGDAAQWADGDPFSGRVGDGRVHGRGACDMKGGVVAGLFAVWAIQEAGVRLNGDLIWESVVGEEMMEHELGTSATVRRGYRADAAIVEEPSAPPYPLTISAISGGAMQLKVICEGKMSHCCIRADEIRAGGRGAAVSVNAIEKGVYLLQALRQLEEQWIWSKRHPRFMPGFFCIHPGVVVGAPVGPLVPYMTPNYCRLEFVVWFPPDVPPQSIRQEIEEHLHKASQLDPWLTEHPPKTEWRDPWWPPAEVPEDHPICQTLAAAHHDATGQGAHLGHFHAVSDASFLNQAGIPAIVYGPGDLALAHCVDEYVEIDEVVSASKAYALCALRWCGTA